MRLGIVLMNLGGPTSEESVRDFLYNLFKDEDIIKMGGGLLQESFARLISRFRSPGVAADYKEINGCPKGCTGNRHCPNRLNKMVSGCCSPINGLTERQRKALEREMNRSYPEIETRVYTCMRYWIPFATTVMDEMAEDGITDAVLLPLYPQFSWTTTGSSFRDWETVRHAKFGKEAPWKEIHVKNYHRNENYLDAINQRIDETLLDLDEDVREKTHFVFSAHGTPLLEVRSGDPYTTEIGETMEAVMAHRSPQHSYWLGYQSRVGPQKWTQPNTLELIEKQLQYGIRDFLIIPIAFVTDHIETLYELGVELVDTMKEKGYEFNNIKVMNGINDHPSFIKALADESVRRLPGSRLPKSLATGRKTESETGKETISPAS